MLMLHHFLRGLHHFYQLLRHLYSRNRFIVRLHICWLVAARLVLFVVVKQQQLTKQKIMRLVAAGTLLKVDGSNLVVAMLSARTFGEGARISMENVNLP